MKGKLNIKYISIVTVLMAIGILAVWNSTRDSQWKRDLKLVADLNEIYIFPYINGNDYLTDESEIAHKQALEASKEKMYIFMSLLKNPDRVYRKYRDSLQEIFGNIRKIEGDEEDYVIEIWRWEGEKRLFVGLEEVEKYSYFVRTETEGRVQVQCIQFVGINIYSTYHLIGDAENEYLVLTGRVSGKLYGPGLAIEIWQETDGIYIPVEMKQKRDITGAEVRYEGVDDGLGSYIFYETVGTDAYSFNNTMLI